MGWGRRHGFAGLVGTLAVLAWVAVADAQVTLRLWVSGPGYDKWLAEVVPAFERQNPGVKVEALTMDWTQYQQKILTGVAGGAGPDVFSFYSVDVAPWATKGLLAPLDGQVSRADFDPVALDNGLWDGKLYAVPMGMKIRAFYYRKDFLKEAGIARAPQTWNEMRDAATRLVKRDAAGNLTRVGFWMPTSHPYKTAQVWLAFLWSNGGEVFDPTGKKAAFNSPEGVESAQFLGDLVHKARVDKPGTIKLDNTDFMQGKVAMLVSNIATRGLLRDRPELRDQVGIAAPPMARKRVVELSGEMFGIAQGSRHKEAAARLLAYLTSRDVVVKYNQVDDNIPGLKAAMDSDYVRSNPFVSQFIEIAKVGRPLPKHPRWSEVSTILTAALDEVFLKGRPAKESMDAAAQKVNSLLAQ
jgi:ABC-type glycerol-3-phosphate transport system substrate-binding protein